MLLNFVKYGTVPVKWKLKSFKKIAPLFRRHHSFVIFNACLLGKNNSTILTFFLLPIVNIKFSLNAAESSFCFY